ncbi:hypothetical protein, partial [Leptospira gomenensis]|uniref:hypothetical protein n=2 Tax=Leptospira gomenensis TaxID=2484974 RepID=UPI001AEFEDF8
MEHEKPLISFEIETDSFVSRKVLGSCTIGSQREISFYDPASDQGVVKLLALEKCNVSKAEYNN